MFSGSKSASDAVSPTMPPSLPLSVRAFFLIFQNTFHPNHNILIPNSKIRFIHTTKSKFHDHGLQSATSWPLLGGGPTSPDCQEAIGRGISYIPMHKQTIGRGISYIPICKQTITSESTWQGHVYHIFPKGRLRQLSVHRQLLPE